LSKIQGINPPNASKGEEMNRTGQDMVVAACGFIFSLATAVILYLIEERTGLALYSFTLWFVIPVGAILAGLVAASGWLLGAWVLNHKPSRLLLANMALASITTFFLIHWLSYISFEVDGKLVSEYVPFVKYMDTILTHQSMGFYVRGRAHGTTGELGWFGYVVALLQVVGFALGALAVYGYLSGLPYCEECRKYFKSKAKQTRYTGNADTFTEMVKTLFASFQKGELQKALDEHGVFGQAKAKGAHLMSQVQRRQCPRCKIQHLQFSAKKLVGNDWKDLNDLSFYALHTGELRP
jgi:hypothetical protein